MRTARLCVAIANFFLLASGCSSRTNTEDATNDEYEAREQLLERSEAARDGTIAMLVGHGAFLLSDGTWVEELPDEVAQRTLEVFSGYLLDLAPVEVLANLSDEDVVGLSETAETPESVVERAIAVRGLLDDVQAVDTAELREVVARIRKTASARALPRAPAETDSIVSSEFDVVEQELVTGLSGTAYRNACILAGVPVPANWKRSDWVNEGVQSTLFVSPANPYVQVYSWVDSTANPTGICIALPRSTSQGAANDTFVGIICQGKHSNKACYFDNTTPLSKNGTHSLTGAGFASGTGLVNNGGGVCTACHAGENAYYVHPNTPVDISQSSSAGRQAAWAARGWVRPLVDASWFQNPGPGKELTRTAPDAGDSSCVAGCHDKASGRRFPRMEFLTGPLAEDGAYCAGLNPIGVTMPLPTPSNTNAFTSHIHAFDNGCVAGTNVTRFAAGAFIWLTNFWTTTEVPRIGDFNGDGRVDLVKFTMGATYDANVSLSNGSSFAASAKWHDFFGLPGEMLRVGDFNGDGRDDILVAALNAAGTVYVATSTGTAFSPFANGNVWNGQVLSGQIVEVGDFNGDRKDDIAVFTKGATTDVMVQLSNGSTSFGAATKWHDAFAGGAEVPLTGDFNGDSFTDIVTFTLGPNTVGTNGDVLVALSNGNSAFGGASVWHGSFGLTGEIQRVADVNGDGFDDIITFVMSSQAGAAAGDVWVAPSNGVNGFGASSKWHSDFGFGSEVPFVADVNADHRADAVVFSTNTNVLVSKAAP